METSWTNIPLPGSTAGDSAGGQNGHFTSNAWNNWDASTVTATIASGGDTRYDWGNHERPPSASAVHSLLFGVANDNRLYTGHRIPDPHMMCLKLGKRHYCEDADRHLAVDSPAVKKRGRPACPYYGSEGGGGAWPPATVARCQVEGCHVALCNAKEYYRRHKVCEVHSKAPKVVVLGLQQRFCQQCSRFHGVTEFDEAKRSCRRRLEGHNQRRRKGSISHSHENNHIMKGRFRPVSTLSPSPPPSKARCALSLLSSPKTEPWISSSDLSSRCSAALCELIAENRATAVLGQFWVQNTSNQPIIENMIDALPNTQIWDRLNDADHTTMTLDLMQAPTSDFGFLSMKEKPKDPEECNDYCWSAFGGTNVV